MTRPLRVLIIEDHDDDAELILGELRRGGYAPAGTRVETLEALARALDDGPWDLVLSDYTMPGFSGVAALELLKQRGLDVPFIIISGTVTEDLAVQAMRAGAHDYVLKERLGRLNPVIERELREAALRGEQRRLEEKLLLADRMASMGTLVAGVAHEINNPLAIVLANLDLLGHLSRPSAGPAPRLDAPAIQETLRDAREAADRVRIIVAGLKTLSRPAEMQHGPVDLHRVIDFSIKMAGNEIRHRARLIKAYGPVPPVLGNEARLGQVFLNLLINAAQSIPEGHTAENQICIATRRGDDATVIIEIHDSGHGIPESVIARIFDPFFTSKGGGGGTGTGLGLSICETIVRSHGGEITASSVVGRGSVFVVRLPAAESPSSDLPSPG
jgi:signal transduction histidine kinase